MSWQTSGRRRLSSTHLLFGRVLALGKLVQRRVRLDLAPKHVLAHVPRQLVPVVLRVFLVADGENGVELFERQVLGSASVASDRCRSLFGWGHRDEGQDAEEETDDERGRRPTFVSGSKKYVYTVANRFHPAYQLNAPCGVKACSSAGHVKEMIKLKPQHVAVAKDMPVSRRYSGNASAGVSAMPPRRVDTHRSK